MLVLALRRFMMQTRVCLYMGVLQSKYTTLVSVGLAERAVKYL